MGKSAINPAVIAAHSADLGNKKNVQTAVSDPTANGSSLTFIDTISQDTQGVISPTKKSVTVDSSPTENSQNPVTSGGVYSQLDALAQRIGSTEQPAAVFQDVAFSIPATSWALNSQTNEYEYSLQSALITGTSGIDVFYDASFRTALVGDISAEKGTNSVLFSTTAQPIGTLSGTVRIIDSVSGIVPVTRGGTGRNDGVGGVIVVNMGTISSLPTTKTVSGVTADMVVIHSELGTPAAFASDITVTTAANSVTLSGTMKSDSSSTVKLTLAVGISVTAT